MEKIKVLHLITELDIGGAEKVLLSLVKKLDRDKYQVIVAYLKGEGKLAEDFRDAGIKVFNLKMRNRVDLGAIIYLYRLLKKGNIKILHTHLIQADMCGFLAGKMAGVPIIISTKHNPDEFRKKFSIPVRLDGIFGNHSDRIIALSHAVKDFRVKSEKICEDKFTVIHNGIDLEEFNLDVDAGAKKKELGIDLSSKIVGMVGRLDHQKGHRFFLQAMPEIVKAVPDVKFLIVGDGPLRGKLEELGREFKVERQVIFTGSRRDIPELISIMDVFVLPSISEGFGNVLLEAMAMGKPVVASRVGGIPEIVTPGLNGLLVEPARPSEMASSVLKLLKDPGEAKRLGEAGREKVKKIFTAETMAKKIEAVYNEIIKGRSLA